VIRVRLVSRPPGEVHFDSEGHAPSEDGRDSAPCAVVSTVVRAFGEAVAERRGCDVRGDVPGPGRFVVDVRARNRWTRAWLAGTVDVARRQLAVAAAAYPDAIDFEYVEEQ